MQLMLVYAAEGLRVGIAGPARGQAADSPAGVAEARWAWEYCEMPSPDQAQSCALLPAEVHQSRSSACR